MMLLKTIIISLFCFFCKVSFAQITFTINKKEINFGTVYIDTVKLKRNYYADITEEKVVRIKNTDNKSLYISDIKWGSGFCLGNFSKNPILPGDSGIIIVFCKAFGKERVFDTTITIITSGGNESIRYKGMFKFMPHLSDITDYEIRLGAMFGNKDIKIGKDTILTYEVKNLSDKKLVLSDFKADELLVVSEDSLVLKPGESKKMSAIFRAKPPSSESDMTKINDYFMTTSKIYFYSSSARYKELITVIVQAVLRQ